MSILIKGMSKPTDCGVCPFEDFGYCSVKGERNTSEVGIDADCPLIEVAEQTEPRIKTADYCDICNHKGCENCVADSRDDYCVPSNFEQTERSE